MLYYILRIFVQEGGSEFHVEIFVDILLIFQYEMGSEKWNFLEVILVEVFTA